MISITDKDKAFMRLVIAKTREGIEEGNWPFGACIVQDDELVAIAHNVVLKSNDPSAHAEITAIRAACQHLNTIDLSHCTIYINCAPCPMCFSAIYWSGIRRIVYGAYTEDYGVLGFTKFAIPPEDMVKFSGIDIEIESGCMREANQKLFDRYLTLYGKAV